ncbi:MAG: hypothetical protein KDD34_00130 [Bdellovibrionales bacterium]|nr:hypothetical protein [Bdellovibrionales bacterium]
MVVSDWNYKRKIFFVSFLVSCCMTLQACSHMSGSGSHLKALEVTEPVTIQLKGAAGDIHQTRFYSHSYSKNFQSGQIVKEKDEIVDFTLEEKIARVNKAGNITLTATTKKKDGIVDLHELAFPEVDEVIEYLYTPQGKVLKAGDYPDWSIFYVPPMPLPSQPVSIGDTWELNDGWQSMNNGIPLTVNLVGIFKNLYACGSDRCVDIEVSGDVSVAKVLEAQMDFVSEIQGRILFNIDKGAIEWSHIQSREDLRMAESQTTVASCLISQLINNEKNSVAPLKCQPGSETIELTPQ